jgi:predicted Rossmann fold flavoprotein
MSRVIVVGGGAAGMMAAVHAARNGNEVHIYEKNEKLGKKIYITGKGRCNLTNACDIGELFQNVMTNEKFLYSAFYSFSNQDVMNFFEELGCALKIERGNRVFPRSDHASDVIRVLVKELERLAVNVHLKSPVADIIIEDKKIRGIVTENGSYVEGDSVIVTTGGLTYPSTGSTGDGYRFAKKAGHDIRPTSPSLVPVQVKEAWVRELQGLSLKNIRLTAYAGEEEVYSAFGEMIFTHFGISGPVVLSLSSYLIPWIGEKTCRLLVDCKPALAAEELDERILRDFGKYKNKQFKNSLDELLPKKLIPVIIWLSGIPLEKQVNSITREERERLISLVKGLPLTAERLRGYNEAVITRGGIDSREINPSTMESKCVKGLYFAGEVIDLDALTGGYNLQIAWSTGYLAGMNAGMKETDRQENSLGS